jgi:hypothetical protein
MSEVLFGDCRDSMRKLISAGARPLLRWLAFRLRRVRQNLVGLRVNFNETAERMRCKTNHADFCVMPISFANCRLLMPFLAVTTRYIACSHLSSGMCDRSKIVPVRTVKSSLQALQR